MRAHLGLALSLMLAVAAGLTYARLQQRGGYALPQGGPAPAFSLPSLRGGAGDLSELRGKVVVLNFWATWCPPCVEEMPSLERLHRGAGQDVAVLTISVDRDDQDLEAFVRKAGLTLPVLRDPEERVSGEYRVTGYPETFIIDPEGHLRDHVVGATDWAAPEAVRHIRSYAKH